MQLQNLCEIIDQEINKTAFSFLSSWKLRNEIYELSQWQNLLNYLTERNEDESSEHVLNNFIDKTKENTTEILAMISSIQQYLNEHGTINSNIEIFDLYIGKSILEIIVGDKNTLLESIEYVYKRSISPTDSINIKRDF